MSSILSKYNVPVPRYTSYPPANFFHEEFTEKDLLDAINLSNTQKPEHISFYIHIPYCKRLCYFCGCNSYIKSKDADENAYVDAVLKEIEIVCARIDPKRKISQIHYGGGSPTSIDLNLIKKINETLLSKFECIENPEIAIECHAGYLDEKDFYILADCKFNRVSIGIQDFSPEVLKACNRIPPKLPIEEIFRILRSLHININLDFIYGLPYQTLEGFRETIKKAVELSPDRLVTFGYAHLPSVFPKQMMLEKAGLPTQELKNNLYHSAQKLLIESGYQQIGLDHFVKKDDELYHALISHSLHRNFQGYCTRRTTGQVYAFGVTGISQLATVYAQNTKSIKAYISAVNTGKLPVLRGYKLNDDEQITREVITALMCNEKIVWKDIARHLHKTTDEIKNATAYNEDKFREMAEDGIIIFDEMKIEMREKGSPFVRNVAASLDKKLLNSNLHFSKPI